MPVKFIPLPADEVRKLQIGGTDAYDNLPEKKISDGVGVPCRGCLKNIKKGEEYLIVAHRPFKTSQPYAETGPIFLHALSCTPEASKNIPEIFTSPQYIVRGYDDDERIVYGTGKVVATENIADYASLLLEKQNISFVHVRSASNNCYHCRIEREEQPPQIVCLPNRAR